MTSFSIRVHFRLLAAFLYAVVLPACAADAGSTVQAAAAPGQTTAPCFLIRVADRATSRGVPLMEVTAPAGIRLYTDSAGYVAFDEAALSNRDVFFKVAGHGYTHPADGFGYRGCTLRVAPGREGVLQVDRVNIAQRLYRITGPGIYADSLKGGKSAPVREPLLNCGVMGQDSVLCTQYRGRQFWVWGDTTTTTHPLAGNFHATAAWSDLPHQGGLDPEVGIDLEYFCGGDFVKPICRMPEKGIYWLSWLMTAPDAQGRERLVARYAKIKPPLTTTERGYVVFDDEEEVFVPLRRDGPDELVEPGGHAFLVEASPLDWIYSVQSSAFLRLPRTFEHVQSGKGFEAFTCLREGERFTTASSHALDRPTSGARVRHSWKPNTAPTGYAEEQQLLKAGLLAPEERWSHYLDAATGKPFAPHTATIAWNPWRKRWTAIISEIFGATSVLGEVWYAEADRPEGPWTYAQKVVTHDRYSFYNPLLHPELAKDQGRVVFFDGTYTEWFSGNPTPTPRYDYNQIMYKLDLDDPRLSLPVAVYRETNGRLTVGLPAAGREADSPIDPTQIAFYAPDRLRPGCVGIALGAGPTSDTWSLKPVTGPEKALFYVLKEKPASDHSTFVPLREYQNEKTGRRLWDVSPPPESNAIGPPLGYVWQNPATSPKGASDVLPHVK